MSNINDIIREALANYLRGLGYDVVAVTSWEDKTGYGGGCSTCAFEYAMVEVGYLDSKGKKNRWEYDDSFRELIYVLENNS